jgi:hypothetical protein
MTIYTDRNAAHVECEGEGDTEKKKLVQLEAFHVDLKNI